MTIAFAALVLAAPAAPSPVTAIEACRSVAGDAARLACFDRAAAAFAEARAKKDVVVMDRAEMRRTKRGLFGFALPSLNLFGGDDDEIAARELDARIDRAAPFGYGYYALTLDDGTEWQTIDRVTGFDPRHNDAIRIKRGPFGYRATSRGSLVAVRRVK